ncbi:ABC transporter substrate-binding protein [Xanthobacter sp. TB0136]|uniref:ABC transporter substrate-binding protein n=1 Tax=Xanthobacter sp. TB0136 TaxID=3459177 RepID=UPI004039D5C1
MNPMSRRALLALAAGVALGLAASGPAAAHPPEPIRIGAILSTTGPGAGAGIPQRNGLLLAAKRLNEKGGINGSPVQLTIEDDGSSPDVAVTKANNLIFSQKVQAIIGPTLTASTLAVGGVADPAKVPVMAITGLGVPMERSRRCVFHMLPSQDLNARALLEVASKELKAAKLGILHDSGYGNIVMAKLKEVSGDYPVAFVAVEKWEVGATDATTQAAKVKATAPDAVAIIGNSATPFRNARQIRLNAPLLSALGTATYEYVKVMGDAADNIVFAEFLVAEDPLPNQTVFVDAFRSEYGVLPKTMEASAWDAFNAVAAGLAKAGPDAPAGALCEAIRGPFEGAMARFDFSQEDLTGLTLKSYVFSRLDKGKFVRLPFKAGS